MVCADITRHKWSSGLFEFEARLPLCEHQLINRRAKSLWRLCGTFLKELSESLDFGVKLE